MRRTRWLAIGGIAFLAAPALAPLVGLPIPLPALVASVIAGAALLVAAVLSSRGAAPAEPATPVDPTRSARRHRRAVLALAGLAAVALTLALVVAIGEARGHAVFHLATGLICLGLFVAVGRVWQPAAGSAGATFRGVTLVLLAVAALGAFLESIGGAGYDTDNAEHRIEFLTTIHNLVTPLAATVMIAVPLGVASLVIGLSTTLRRRAIRTGGR